VKIRSAFRPIRILAEQTALPWHVSKQNVDVLWSPGYTAPLYCPCPQLVTIHDLQYKTYPEDLSFLERITLDFLVKNACKRCDLIITVSEFSKREIIRFNYATDDKIDVVLEGVDPIFGEPVDFDISQIVNMPKGTPYILCVAHTYPHKKVHVLIQAFGTLTNKIPHHLILVGKARRGESKVQEALNHLSDHKKMHRISDLEYHQLNALYQAADLFVLPSVYEGFGLPVLEALMAGIPVLTTREASLPEVGGACAVYFDDVNSECISQAILDVHSRGVNEKMLTKRNSKIWAKSFSWKKSAKETMSLLQNLRLKF
jgi:glycosyltransferase involved in cell wall biosynthesis